MRPRQIHHMSGVTLSALAPFGLVHALAACTAISVRPTTTAMATAIPSTATPTPTRAELTCAASLFPIPFRLPPVRPATKAAVGHVVELLCLATGAPTSDTSFTLTLVIAGQSPPIPPTSSPCVGMLQ